MAKRFRKPARQAIPAKKPVPARPKKEFDAALMCGAKKRNSMKRFGEMRYCQNLKGFKTPHQGEGRCWLHGGLTPIKHGMDSLIKHGRLKDLIQKMREIDHDLLDLTPEVETMRALTIDFINRYDDFTEALTAWYDALDDKRREDSDGKLPPIPRKYPELEDAAKLLEGISRVAERYNKIKREGSISLDVFRGTMTEMGMIVAKVVDDPKKLLLIEEGWQAIMVDPRSFYRDKLSQDGDDEEGDE